MVIKKFSILPRDFTMDHGELTPTLKIRRKKINENWLIVTTAFHMSRALNIAEKLDWKFIPYAVDFRIEKKFSWKPTIHFLRNISYFQTASHEWLGLIAYYWMGRSNKIL